MKTLPELNRSKGVNVVSSALSRYTILGSPSPNAFLNKLDQIRDEINLNKTAIIFADVLRATTTLTGIAAAGCPGIYFCVKPKNGDYDLTPPFNGNGRKWIYGGEENGKSIPGGVIGNSLLSINPKIFSDHYLKFYSTNGARALDAITQTEAGGVFLISLANVEATINTILSEGFERVWFVGGGFYGNATLEDNVCTGRAIRLLAEKAGHKFEPDDEALMMKKVAESYGDDDERLIFELINGQVAGVLKFVSRLKDVAACVNGTGIESLWNEMSRTVVRLEWIENTPLLTAKKSKND